MSVQPCDFSPAMAIKSETSGPSHPQTLDHSQTSPSKRLKTLISPKSEVVFDDNCEPNSCGICLPHKTLMSPKSEDPDVVFDDNYEPNSCGICLMEGGRAIRGFIDSCDHYFCFVCILEWSKVESRCPLCKRRFSTIRRPPKPGLFLGERIVNVPVRDQVYHFFGNATVEPHPYLEVQCSVCQSGADESLLLLCDLCETAFHTYCVGLGATVPEGDWFCQDCTISMTEHIKSEIDTECASEAVCKNFHEVPPDGTSVSIFDIVAESSIAEVRRPARTDHRASQLSSSIAPNWGTSAADNVSEGDSRTTAGASNATSSGARTLQRCRNVNDRIRALRENWNGFRSEALSFCSGSVDLGGTTNERHNVDTSLHNNLGPSYSRSCKGQQLTAHNDTYCTISPNSTSYNIEKAWKMMNVAKSIEKGHGKATFMHQASTHHSSKVNVPKGKANMNPFLRTANSKKPGTMNLNVAGCKRHYQYHSVEKVNDLPKTLMFEKQKQRSDSIVKDSKVSEGFPTNSAVYELSSARKAQTSAQVDVCCANGGKGSETYPFGDSSVLKKHDGSAVGPVQILSSFTCATVNASSSCMIETHESKYKMEGKSAKSKSKREDDVKTEIQSLVKLNLKLLSGDKKLEANAFKEVARLATHSILTACGLEQPKPGVHSFPSSVCCHNKQVEQLRMSTLMPSSCRECFYIFVKDVVKTMMDEKIDCV